jgi:hypothetical protein
MGHPRRTTTETLRKEGEKQREEQRESQRDKRGETTEEEDGESSAGRPAAVLFFSFPSFILFLFSPLSPCSLCLCGQTVGSSEVPNPKGEEP